MEPSFKKVHKEKITAESVREWLKHGEHETLDGKEITGSLDLSEMWLDRPVRFIDCDFTGPIILTGAHAAKGIRLERCTIHSLQGDRLDVDGDLVFEKVHSHGEISLVGAQVNGHLRCTGSTFLRPSGTAFIATAIAVKGSTFFDEGFVSAGTVKLDSSRVTGRLLCNGGKFRNKGGLALSANGLDCPDVRLSHGFTVTGTVSLVGAVISRELNCSGSTFDNEDDVALKADGLICKGKIYLNEEKFRAKGEVVLRNARITTELNCSDGTFENNGRHALSADGLTCDGNVFLNGKFRAIGKVQLANARITTELNCTGGTFENNGHHALSTGGLTCDGNVFLNDGFQAIGGVELVDTRIGGQLNCANGRFGKFDAQRLVVGGKFVWLPGETPEEVNLSFAEIGLLEDRPASWPDNTYLAGFTFRNLSEKNFSLNCRINWLKQVEYAPGMYRQLTRIYREKGLGGEARDVAIAGQRDRRERGGMSGASQVWSRFLDHTVRYGYSIQRPLYIVIVWGVLGTVLFYFAQHRGVMMPVSGLSNTEPPAGTKAAAITATKCTAGYPCFIPPAYSFELFFPGVNLRQLMFWLPSTTTWLGWLSVANVWLAILAGWALSAAVVAGIGHLFSQRD